MADRYESQARAQTENLHDPKSVIIYYHLHATYTANIRCFCRDYYHYSDLLFIQLQLQIEGKYENYYLATYFG
jgi:hypothetical protein